MKRDRFEDKMKASRESVGIIRELKKRFNQVWQYNASTETYTSRSATCEIVIETVYDEPVRVGTMLFFDNTTKRYQAHFKNDHLNIEAISFEYETAEQALEEVLQESRRKVKVIN